MKAGLSKEHKKTSPVRSFYGGADSSNLQIQCSNRHTIRAFTNEMRQVNTKLRQVDVHRHWLRKFRRLPSPSRGHHLWRSLLTDWQRHCCFKRSVYSPSDGPGKSEFPLSSFPTNAGSPFSPILISRDTLSDGTLMRMRGPINDKYAVVVKILKDQPNAVYCSLNVMNKLNYRIYWKNRFENAVALDDHKSSELWSSTQSFTLFHLPLVKNVFVGYEDVKFKNPTVFFSGIEKRWKLL